MKKRWAWRYTVVTQQGTWWGTCPTWRHYFTRYGVDMKSTTTERVLVVGGRTVPCFYHSEGHPEVSLPEVITSGVVDLSSH